jgi:hypothetical protein
MSKSLYEKISYDIFEYCNINKIFLGQQENLIITFVLIFFIFF